jgi:hypothetical protein
VSRHRDGGVEICWGRRIEVTLKETGRGMEGWRDKEMKGCRDGRVEGWRGVGMEGWRDGGV